MEAHEPGHPAAGAARAVTGTARIRDVATGEVRTADAWVAERMSRERRERDECLDELVNALARGDLVLDEPAP